MPYASGNNIGDQAAMAENMFKDRRNYADSRADAEYNRGASADARDQANYFRSQELDRQSFQDQQAADQQARFEYRQAGQDASSAERGRFDMGLMSEQSKLARERFDEDKKYAADTKVKSDMTSNSMGEAGAASLYEAKLAKDAAEDGFQKANTKRLGWLHAAEVQGATVNFKTGTVSKPGAYFTLQPERLEGLVKNAESWAQDAKENVVKFQQADKDYQIIQKDLVKQGFFTTGRGIVNNHTGTEHLFKRAQPQSSSAPATEADQVPMSANLRSIMSFRTQMRPLVYADSIQRHLESGRITAAEATQALR